MSEELEIQTDEQKAKEWAEVASVEEMVKTVKFFARDVEQGERPGHRLDMPSKKAAIYVMAAAEKIQQTIDALQANTNPQDAETVVSEPTE